jgi:hypothetical protein
MILTLFPIFAFLTGDGLLQDGFLDLPMDQDNILQWAHRNEILLLLALVEGEDNIPG